MASLGLAVDICFLVSFVRSASSRALEDNAFNVSDPVDAFNGSQTGEYLIFNSTSGTSITSSGDSGTHLSIPSNDINTPPVHNVGDVTTPIHKVGDMGTSQRSEMTTQSFLLKSIADVGPVTTDAIPTRELREATSQYGDVIDTLTVTSPAKEGISRIEVNANTTVQTKILPHPAVASSQAYSRKPPNGDTEENTPEISITDSTVINNAKLPNDDKQERTTQYTVDALKSNTIEKLISDTLSDTLNSKDLQMIPNSTLSNENGNTSGTSTLLKNPDSINNQTNADVFTHSVSSTNTLLSTDTEEKSTFLNPDHTSAQNHDLHVFKYPSRLFADDVSGDEDVINPPAVLMRHHPGGHDVVVDHRSPPHQLNWDNPAEKFTLAHLKMLQKTGYPPHSVHGLIWEDREYVVSVLIPVILGVIGALTCVCMAFCARSCHTTNVKVKPMRNIQNSIEVQPSFNQQKTDQLPYVDRIMLLADSSDDDEAPTA